MAKKVRRVRKPRAVTTGKGNGAEKASSAKPRLSSAEQFRHDYAYVIKDLRQILILAILMFALLIALNLFLR